MMDMTTLEKPQKTEAMVMLEGSTNMDRRMALVVIGGGHAGIVPTPRNREAERGSGGLNVPHDRREASIPMADQVPGVMR